MASGGRPPRKEFVWVTALFTVLTLLLTYPLSLHPGSTVLPLGGDTRLFLWTIGWDVHAFTHQPWAIFDANIFAPERLTLAYSENCLGSAVFAAPFLWVASNPVLAMNAVVLLSCVLCGLGTYLLARQLGMSRGASLIAGSIFAFAPPRFLRLGQLHLAPVQWVPFCLAYLDRYFSDGRSRDLKLAVLFFALQAMTSGHAGLFLIVAIGCVVLWQIARREPLRLTSLPRDLGVVGFASLALVVLLMVPYLVVRQEQAWVRTLDEARLWSPNAASFLESPSHVHRALQSVLGWHHERAKAALFPGVLPLLLAPFGLWAAFGTSPSRRRIGAYVLVALVSFWLALGPDYGLYAVAYKLPASNFIRVPSRYATLTLLSLAVFAAAGFDYLGRSMASRARVAAAAASVLWLAFEFAVVPLGTAPYDRGLPEADRWLASRPSPFVVAEVPVIDGKDEARANSRQSIYMMHSTAHWQKTVHGYSGYEPPEHTALYRELLAFPDDASLARLRRFGVTYVVVHESYYSPGEWTRVREALGKYPSELVLLYNDQQARIYAFKRAAP